MTLTPKSPACILYAAMRGGKPADHKIAFWLNSHAGKLDAERYTAAAKAVRDAALDEAAAVCETYYAGDHGNPMVQIDGRKIATALRLLKDKFP